MTRDIKKPIVDREYITNNQPWPLDALPREYVPHPATKWYPPVFGFGVALSKEETERFAEHFDIPIDKEYYENVISKRLTESCGARFTTRCCDMGGGPDESIQLFPMVTNYDVHKVEVTEPLEKFCEVVEKVFGSSKQIGWWLEYTANHSPDHYRVSNLLW